MFVSGCTVLSGKAHVSGKEPSQDQRETQPGVTQTGRGRGERERERERYEVREGRGSETGKERES